MKFSVLLLLITTFALSSCKKEMTQSGSSGLAYRYSYEYPLEIRPVLLKDRIVIQDIYPYGEMIGQVAANVSEGSINGKPIKFSDIQISGVRVSSVSVGVLSQKPFMQSHLTDSKLVYKYYANGTEQEVVLASSGYYSDSKINYMLNSSDLTEIFKAGKVGSFYIDFGFNSNAVSENIAVYYDIFFNYDYTMKQYKK